MDVLVVGAGAMGRWFGRTVEADVAFADVDPEAAAAAAAAVGDRARTAPLDGDGRFDVVCVAVPISVATEAVECHAGRARSAVVDVTGVMGPLVTAMREVVPDRERASLHPLFAPDHAPGTVAVVRDAGGPATDALLAALRAAGNRLFETTAEEHDEAMETVQAATHAAVLSFALAAREVDPAFHTPVSRRLASLVDTVAGGDPGVYREIQATFDGADRVAAAAERVAAATDETFDALYREAGRVSLGSATDPTDDPAVDDPPGTDVTDPDATGRSEHETDPDARRGETDPDAGSGAGDGRR